MHFYFPLCFPPHLSETKNSLLPSFSALSSLAPQFAFPQLPFSLSLTDPIPFSENPTPLTSTHSLSVFPKPSDCSSNFQDLSQIVLVSESQASIARTSMSAGARAPNRSAQPHNGAVQIPPPPPKRNLAALASTKPPFVPPDDYHRFSSAADSRRAAMAADHEAEVIVVRSPVSLLCLFLLMFGLGMRFTWPVA